MKRKLILILQRLPFFKPCNREMKTKHIILILVFFLVSTTPSDAQDTLLLTNRTKIDSLEQLKDSREANDQVKVRLLNDYAQLCFHNNEFLKGLVACSICVW